MDGGQHAAKAINVHTSLIVIDNYHKGYVLKSPDG